jgi:hypothetical protein
MKTILQHSTSRRFRTAPSRRQQLLAEFDHSGLSAYAFARKHHIAYSTFCQWRQQRDRLTPVSFTEVEIARPGPAEPLVVELGPHARVCVSSPEQLELVAGLLKHLQA